VGVADRELLLKNCKGQQVLGLFPKFGIHDHKDKHHNALVSRYIHH
jgi:hypothetical protein